MTEEIRIRVNGEELRLPEGSNVTRLLERLNIGTPRVAVERNREIVPKARYESQALADGDVLEIVELVGGG